MRMKQSTTPVYNTTPSVAVPPACAISRVFTTSTGVLNTAAFGSAVIDFNKDYITPTNSGQLIFTMRPDLFRDMAEFKAEMDMRIQEIRNSTPMEGADPIRLPGEMALEREQQMRSKGVPVAGPVLLQLREIAYKLELPDCLDDMP